MSTKTKVKIIFIDGTEYTVSNVEGYSVCGHRISVNYVGEYGANTELFYIDDVLAYEVTTTKDGKLKTKSIHAIDGRDVSVQASVMSCKQRSEVNNLKHDYKEFKDNTYFTLKDLYAVFGGNKAKALKCLKSLNKLTNSWAGECDILSSWELLGYDIVQVHSIDLHSPVCLEDTKGCLYFIPSYKNQLTPSRENNRLSRKWLQEHLKYKGLIK